MSLVLIVGSEQLQLGELRVKQTFFQGHEKNMVLKD